jgi:deazaflavin-dependent oxidoreductase (nitroreductase family)
MLLLTTRGRATGNEHTVPLLYLRDGECLVVVASYGGRDRHPEWYLNLVTEPSVTAQIGRKRKSFRARTAGDDERERWWPRVVAAYSDYAVYQGRTERQIPLIMLEPPGLT